MIGIGELLGSLIMIIYCGALAAITIYCLIQFHLLFYYKRKVLGVDTPAGFEVDSDQPFVTIQLPIYNEMYVVKRLLESITNLDYPKDKFEIHILDDSTDQTSEILVPEVKKYRDEGFIIEHITRGDRKGYKAGALQSAMPRARGEFIAIFDADFLPKTDFLKQTLAYFQNPSVGVVQTRWEHLNQNYSLLTRVQAFQLNVHFTVEQLGRRKGDLLLQFNGTAGVWRKSTIDDAGGWEADTLTEDLDLSYRAQLKGWQIVYLEDVTSPAELPAEMSGLKSQQFRWMKGGAETAKKMLPTIWKSGLSLRQKLHASAHLLGSTVFLAVFVIGVFSVPLAYFIQPLNIDQDYFIIFLTGLVAIFIIYYVANVEVVWKSEPRLRTIGKFVFLFPLFLALSMGLSLHNSLAVIQGYIGKKSPFVRTPKFALSDLSDKLTSKKYFKASFDMVTFFEGLFFLYFTAGFLWGIYAEENTFVLFHLILAIGYGLIFYFSTKNWFLSLVSREDKTSISTS